MTATIRFTVPGAPCAKAKKLAVLNGHARGYNDKKTATYQNLVTLAAERVRPALPLAGPLVLDVVAVYPRLQSQCVRSKRTGALLGGWPEGRIPRDIKPDFDNLAKALCDGINASGLWEDDARVFDGRVRKYFAATNEVPHVEVVVRPAGIVSGGIEPLTYLASPYSHPDTAVREGRYRAACAAAAALTARGELVYSPIAHGHGISQAGTLPDDWAYWQRVDLRMMGACDSLTVLCIDGWRESRGIAAELALARAADFDIRFIDVAGNDLEDCA